MKGLEKEYEKSEEQRMSEGERDRGREERTGNKSGSEVIGPMNVYHSVWESWA